MINKIIGIALEAGNILLEIRKKGFEVRTKENEFDFVTEADEKADKYIREKLIELFPNDRVLSEESSEIPNDFSKNVWMVDPLDGTKDFVNGGVCFSVMIGLCENGVPTLGVVYAPAQKLLYYAEKGKGAFMKKQGKTSKLIVSKISKLEDSKIVTRFVQGEKRDADLMIDALPTLDQIQSSSVGIVLGLICQAEAEIYIFTNKRGSKWDTCGPQVILEESGGKITDWDGNSLDYKQESLRWENLFVATNGQVHDQVLNHIKDFSRRPDKYRTLK